MRVRRGGAQSLGQVRCHEWWMVVFGESATRYRRLPRSQVLRGSGISKADLKGLPHDKQISRRRDAQDVTLI